MKSYRHDEIQTFTAESYWTLNPVLDVEGRRLKLDWDRGRIFNLEVATYFERALKKHKFAVYLSIHSFIHDCTNGIAV
jgi:DNA topoisomerase-3